MEIEDEMKRVVTSSFTLFESFSFDDGDDRNELLKFGGATSYHNEVLLLREKFKNKNKDFRKKEKRLSKNSQMICLRKKPSLQEE